MKKLFAAAAVLSLAFAGAAFGAQAASVMPGEAGFEEIPIGTEQQVGPYTVAAVYFQAVDMYPAGKNPSKEDSDMHLEADIHLLPVYAIAYGFGNGDNIWPAYLTVKYEVRSKDGKDVVMSGSFMPMNADDGPHYGANIAKGLKVGQYKLRFIIEPPTDYLLHTDPETGVPAKEDSKNFFQTYTVDFDWNYTAEQLQNE
ncbi:MAG: iron transporter [Fretibacterium sp.]|nr:iron transporter [Fretibacterium sp.]